jgi:hypothetical protein
MDTVLGDSALEEAALQLGRRARDLLMLGEGCSMTASSVKPSEEPSTLSHCHQPLTESRRFQPP